MAETKGKINIKQIRKNIFNMILPITIERVLQMTAGIVSMALIGRISKTAVNGLNLSTRITQIIFALFNGVTVGATVFVAQSFGAKDFSKLRKVIQQTLLFSIILVIFLQQIVFWNGRSLLGIFNPSSTLMENGLIYLKTVSWGLPFMAIMLVVAGSLQGMGNTKTPMIITMIMNLINLTLGYILIFGAFGVPKLGLKGAAIALAVAQFMGAMIGLWVLFRKNGVLNSVLSTKFFKIDLKEILAVLRVGLPSSMESILWQIAAIILTRVILTFGETALAAHSMGMQAESISYMPAFGFSIVATAFIGQAVGARDSQSGRAYLRETIKGSILITSVGVFFLVFFPRQVMMLLTNDKDVINLGAYYLIIMGLVQIPQNLAGVFGGALRGAGFTKVPMITAFAGLWGVRVPFTLILTLVFHLNIIAIWAVMGADLIVRFIISFFMYKRKNIYEAKSVIESAS